MGRGAADEFLIEQFEIAREDPALVVLEGFHALKHALRFGAEVGIAATCDGEELERLSRELAPDLRDLLLGEVWVYEGRPSTRGGYRDDELEDGLAVEIDEDVFRALGGRPHHTRVAAIAQRPAVDLGAALAGHAAPAVLLEDPRHLGNLGAAVRVAAAADAAAVLTVGDVDPWDPVAVRGSAGLHFALAVGRVESDGEGGGLSALLGERPLLALDPDGDELDVARLPPDAVYAFGSERAGLSDELLAAADARLAIPMRPGVSSLNLATAVAAVLFARRLGGG